MVTAALAKRRVWALALLAAALCASRVAHAQVGSWRFTGNLATIRDSHTATLLSDGRVLVVGGQDTDTTPLASAEIWDPTTGVWSAAGTLAEKRSAHTATRLRDGRVLIAGGYDDTAATPPRITAEIWDPATGTFSSTGSLATRRFWHTAVLLADGRVLVAGGCSSNALPCTTYPVNTEIWDPATGLWSPGGNLATPGRHSLSAVVLQNGSVLLVGGAKKRTVFIFTYEDAVETTETWTAGTWTVSTSNVETGGRNRSSATVLPDGRVLHVAGVKGDGVTDAVLATAELRNPATGAWTATGPLTNVRRGLATALLPDGRVLALAGDSSKTGAAPLASVEVWSGGSWTPEASLGNARFVATATVLPSGQVLVVGGVGSGGIRLASAEVWTPGTGAWSPSGSLVPARDRFGAASLRDGRVMAAGGDDGVDALSSVQIWDFGTWTAGAPMASRRRDHTATLTGDGRVLVAGGGSAGTLAMTSAEVWDPVLQTWSATGSLSPGRRRHTATLLPDGSVMAAFGVNAAGSDLDTSQLWSPTSGLWTSTAPAGAAAARRSHTATLLQSGSVLITGGEQGAVALDDCRLWDSVMGTWSTTGPLPAAQALHTATLLADGRVLAVGGKDAGGAARTGAATWSAASRTWTPTGVLTTARWGHRASLLPDGRVLVSGGENAGGAVSTTEIFDPVTGSWTATGSSVARSDHLALVLPDNRVLIAGGRAAGAPLASSETWKPGPDPATNCRPTLANAGAGLPADPWPSGSTIPAVGTQLLGCSEGSSGWIGSSSPSNFPVVRLFSLSDGSVWDGRFTNSRDWSATGVTFTTPGDAGLAAGYYVVQAVVAGIPSAGRIVRLSRTHEKLYLHRESPAAGTRELSTLSPASASGHVVNLRDSSACASLAATGVTQLEYGCGAPPDPAQFVFPAGGFLAGDPRAISGPLTLRAEVRGVGAAAGVAYLFARIKRHGDGSLIHETEPLTSVNLGAVPLSPSWQEAQLRLVVPPRAADLATCPSATIPCASTTLPIGDRVRVEWWIRVVSAGAGRSVELLLEAPGSTAASLPRLSTETLAGTPLAARIGGLEASRIAEGVEISWELFEPWEVVRMAVARADSEGGPFASLGEAVEPAGALLETGSYARLDPEPPRTPWYRLEVTLADGTVEIHGPVSPALDQESAPGCGCRAPNSQVSPRGALAMAAAALVLLLVLRLRAAV